MWYLFTVCQCNVNMPQRTQERLDCKTVVSGRFRKARSAASAILAYEAPTPHTPVGVWGDPLPFLHSLQAFRSNIDGRPRWQKIRLFCSLRSVLLFHLSVVKWQFIDVQVPFSLRLRSRRSCTMARYAVIVFYFILVSLLLSLLFLSSCFDLLAVESNVALCVSVAVPAEWDTTSSSWPREESIEENIPLTETLE